MRKNDVICTDNKTFHLYWDTALDGKRWCRVKVFDPNKTPRVYQYSHYFKTKKAARIHILTTEVK